MTYEPTQEEIDEEIKYNWRLVGMGIPPGHSYGESAREYEEIEKKRALEKQDTVVQKIKNLLYKKIS